MKDLFLFFIIYFLFVSNVMSQEFGSFKDARDGNVYKTIKIGSQIWMAENLHSFNFRNGDPIPIEKKDKFWSGIRKTNSAACSYYENNLDTGDKYGLLYNWDAINDPRGLAPEGWHIPTETEWKILINNLGGIEVAGAKLKSTKDWESFESEINCDVCHEWTSQQKAGEVCAKCLDKRKIKGLKYGYGNNSSGFSGLPGGLRFYKSVNLGIEGHWWSTSISPQNFGYFSVHLRSQDNSAKFSYSYACYGFSVRCIKD
jgi:uncharacterized protein (TIGR02145 family)